jgi:cytochrome c oxidase assembly protein subunit 11
MAVLVGVVAGMVGLSFASVPLYRAFCRATGFGGTTRRVDQASAVMGARTVTIRFNADVNQGLPWDFHPENGPMVLRLGQTGLASFRAVNHAGRAVSGVAVYNVTPDKVGIYFNKIQCFCFNEQTLTAHQAVDMPVSFYVDPAFARDPSMADVDTITLSYTFFESRSGTGPSASGAPSVSAGTAVN